MEHLKLCRRSKVLHNLAKALGTKREDHSDTLLPAKRMPMGLIEHCVNFFVLIINRCHFTDPEVINCVLVIVVRFIALMTTESG